jgi:hypothetical protein
MKSLLLDGRAANRGAATVNPLLAGNRHGRKALITFSLVLVILAVAWAPKGHQDWAHSIGHLRFIGMVLGRSPMRQSPARWFGGPGQRQWGGVRPSRRSDRRSPPRSRVLQVRDRQG